MPTQHYMKGFPKSVHHKSLVACAFFAILHNRRALTKREKFAIVSPAIKFGLIMEAPVDEYGVQVCQQYRKKRIEQSKTGFIMTPKGKSYWQRSVRPNIPDHISDLGYAEKKVKKISANDPIVHRRA